MAIYYFDSNATGANNGTSPVDAFTTLNMLNNNFTGHITSTQLPAGSTLYFARGSLFAIVDNIVLHNYIDLSMLVNGASGSPIIMTAYGSTSLPLPKFKYTMQPSAGDWVWDATNSAWYLTTTNNIAVGGFGLIINGAYIPLIGHFAAGSDVPSLLTSTIGTNGLTANTLRFMIPTGSKTLYIAGGGLTSAADPTTFFGASNLVIYPRALFYAFRALAYTDVSYFDFEGGGFCPQYGAATANYPGFVMHHCTGNNVTSAYNPQAPSATGIISFTFHDNVFTNIMTDCLKPYGVVSGESYNNKYLRGNLCTSFGGAIHWQAANISGQTSYVHDEYAEYFANGVGDRTFDGCCFYGEEGSSGTVWERNVAAHSYLPWQENSGAVATWRNNIAFDCCKDFYITDSGSVGTSNYTFDSNLFISSISPNTYTKGDAHRLTFEGGTNVVAANIFTASNPSGSVPITAFTCNNNLQILNGDYSSYTPRGTYNDAIMSGGTPVIKNNCVIGNFGTKPKVSKASSGGNYDATYPTNISGALTGNDIGYVNGLPAILSPSSIAAGAGLQATTQETDYHGTVRFSPRSIGALEVARPAQVFSPAWVGL
jgi:hypothetical protein